MHEPLSEKLTRILESNSGASGLTLNKLIETTEGRGLYLVVILLSLPFIVPISIPGVSTVLGLTVALLCFRLAFRLPPRLPRFMGDRPLPPAAQRKLLAGSVRFLKFVERLVKPRRTRWMATRWGHCGNALLMTLMALFLALPFPPLPPFTNSLPCYAIILLAASMMEEDGVLIWFGYVVAIGTIIYLGLVVEGLEYAITKTIHLLREKFAR